MMADPLDWRERAACKGEDLILFFGPSEGEIRETTAQKETRTKKAKQICRGCPVAAECLAYHLRVSASQHGVAGGLDEDERRTYRRRELRRSREERQSVTRDVTDKAINALAHRVYERDHADPGDRASTTDFAFEFVTWLRANGWSHTPPAAPPPHPAPGTGLRGAELARHVLAQTTKGASDGR
ncbi:WhiB family transcriptional regulator [Streptosporangium canum]|uniref:WhiB family transcriptional regulator n=1 Tax=Streptosporangium canum TaxID=324952 RepID=UPI0036C83A3B